MKRLPEYDAVKVGDELPPLSPPPITRQALAVYCGASGDHNPIHVDIDFARESGLDDVITHGMLVMAYMGRMLTQWVPQSAVRGFETRFLAITRVGDRITASGRVVEKLAVGEERCVRVEIIASDQTGEAKTSGSAVIALA
ncbi:MAG: MaoC family dehydratase [Proteobacteria bacterium]|nr:MaoC family dehydratase [Pseudomonadota bacterium]